MFKNQILSLMILALLASVGCGKQSLETEDQASKDNIQQNDPQDQEDPKDERPTWDMVSLEGRLNQGSYNKMLVVYIDQKNQSLMMTLPVPVLVPFYQTQSFPGLPEASLKTVTNPDGSYSLAVNVPLKVLIKNGEFVNPQRLPNGDPLPFVPDGELPGFALSIPGFTGNLKVRLYVGTGAAAVFTELPDLKIPGQFTLPVENKSKTKVIGAFGYIPKKGIFANGMYIATTLPEDLAKTIDDLIRWEE